MQEYQQPETPINTTPFRELLTNLFSDGELRNLCFDLGIDYESLPGGGKADKARELIAYAQRHRQIDQLLNECRRLRPHADWDAVKHSATSASLSDQREAPVSDAITKLEQEIAALKQALASLASMPMLGAPLRQQLEAKESELAVLRGESPPVRRNVIDFGSGNKFGDVTIGDVAGGNIHKATINLGPTITGPISSGRDVNIATNQEITNYGDRSPTASIQTGGVLSGGTKPVTLPDKLPPVSLAVGAVAEAPRQPGTLTLSLAAEGRGYHLSLDSGEHAPLPITAQKLADLNARARVELLAIVHDQELGVESYTRGIDIPQEQAARSLARLAILGADLWRNLFAGPGASRDSITLGERLRQRSQSADLTITVSGEVSGFPWQLLYDRDPEAEITPEGFWGLRHILSLQPARARVDAALGDDRLGGAGPLTALVGYNRSLDNDAGRQVVAEQATTLEELGVFARDLANEQALRNALAKGSPVDLIYLYCHVVNAQPGQQLVGAAGPRPPGVGETRIILTNEESALTYEALSRAAPLSRAPLLTSGPLVLLNACGSAALSPLSYDGLAPYLLDLGARAVVGTETDTPVVFGAAFGPTLLRALFQQGLPLGAALRAARRQLAAAPHFNHLGLLYTLYGRAALAVANPGGAV